MPRCCRCLLLVAALACGGGGGAGTASLAGTIRGKPLVPKDAESALATIQVKGLGAVPMAAIVLTGQPGLCAVVSRGQEPKSAQYLFLFLGTLVAQDGGSVSLGPPAAAGAFTVYPGVGSPATANVAVIVAQTTDAACQDQPALDAAGVSGTVQLTSLSGGAFAGSFDLLIAEGVDGSGNAIGATEHLTGSFSTRSCSGLGALFSPNATQCI